MGWYVCEKRAPFVAMSNKEKEEVRQIEISSEKDKKVNKTTKSPSSKTNTLAREKPRMVRTFQYGRKGK